EPSRSHSSSARPCRTEGHHWTAKRGGPERYRERSCRNARLAICSGDGPMLRMTARIGMLAVVPLILIGAHGIIIYYFSSHLALSTAVLSTVIILVFIHHLSFLRPFFVVFPRP